MLLVHIDANRIACEYKPSDDCASLLAEQKGYTVLGNDYSYSWLKNDLGLLAGVEFYPPDETDVFQRLSTLVLTNPQVTVKPFCRVHFNSVKSDSADETPEFGDYYLVSDNGSELLFMFPTSDNSEMDFSFAD